MSDGGSAPSHNKKTLGIVFLTVFLDLIGFGIIIPIQPFYAEQLGASPWTVTLLGGSFSLMQFLFAPIWGRLSDRVGRRPVMLISIAIGSLGYLLFGLSRTLVTLFAARMISGFGAANIGTAQAIIADSTTPENRAKGMGLIGAAFGLGFIFGPALGGGFVQLGLAVPAFVAAGLSAINWFSAFFILPETNLRAGTGTAKASSHRPGFSWTAIRHAARHPNVAQLFLVYLVYATAFSLMEQVLGLFIEHFWLHGPHAMSAADPAKKAAALTTYFLIVVGVTSTIIQGGLIGRLARTFGERKLLRVGTLLIGLAFFGINMAGATGSYLLLLALAALMATGTGVTNPSTTSLLSRAVDPDEQGGVLGIGQSLAALGRILGPGVAGALFQLSAEVPFWVGGVLMVVCSGIALSVRQHPVIGETACATSV